MRNLGRFGDMLSDETMNRLNTMVEMLEVHGKTMQDLVAEGQLTPEQYEMLIKSVNGLISKGDITLNDLKPDVLSAIEGGESTTFNLLSIPRDKSVTPSKTTFMKKTRNLFDGIYRTGALAVNSGNMILNNDYGNSNTSNLAVIPIESGVTYTVKVHDSHDVLRIAVNNTEPIYAGNNNLLDRNILNTRSSSEHTFTNTSSGRYLLVQTSESNQKPRLQVEKGATSTEYVEPFEIPKEVVQGLSEVFDITSELDAMFPKFELIFSQGSIASSGENIDNALTRVHTAWLDLERGDTVEILDKSYDIAIAGLPTTFTWQNTDYTHQQTQPIRFMVRKNNGNNITPKDASDVIKIITGDSVVRKSDVSKIINESSNLNIIKYVTLNGEDSNTGDSVSNAYSTLQKAVDEGARTVYMERGDYRQSFRGSVDNLTILPINDDNTDPSTVPRENITFIGSDKLEGWSEFEGIYRKSVTRSYPNFKDVFIDNTKPISSSGNRPQYNAILWESSNIVDDYVMKPVLSISEVKSDVGSFYYDGDYIYIHPENIDNNFYVPYISKGLDFRGTKNLILEDVTAEYFLREGIDVDKVTKINAQNCQSNHSAYADGFSADYTNGKFINCKGFRNRNDAFNLHFYGDTEFINCIGEYNYDDGVSHHEHCTGVVIGGSFSFNGKAGSAPVQEAKVNHYNVKFEGNDYGILNSRAGEGNISSGNLFKENRFGISSNNSGDMTSFNDKFIENSSDIITNGVVNQY